METGSTFVSYEVRRRLREGIQPDTHLTEGELARATGHNRASVRQALTRAQAEGTLMASPGRGAVVPRHSSELCAQLWSCLARLEEVIVTRVIILGIDVSILDDAVTSADELTFHRLLGELLPAGEPARLFHGYVIARLEQDPNSASEHLLPAGAHLRAHRELREAIQASALSHAVRTAREHLEELASAAEFGPMTSLLG